MLKPDLSCQLPDTVHEVFTLAMNNFGNVIKLILCHPESRRDSLGFSVNFLELLLLRREVFSELQTHVLLSLEILFHSELLSAALLQFSLALQKLLLLFHGLLHLLVASEQLLLHILDLLKQRLLLALFFLLSFLLSLKFAKQLLSFLFSDGSLSLELCALLFELLTDLELVLFQSCLHLRHLLFVNSHDDVGSHLASSSGSSGWTSSLHIDLAS